MKTAGKLTSIGIFAAVLLSACTLPFTPRGSWPVGTIVLMERPYRGMLYPVGVATRISGSASTPGGGVEALEFFANGRSLGVIATDRAAADVSASLTWTPTTPGSHVLQVNARGLRGVAVSEPVTVCVASVLDYVVEGYLGPCSFEPSASTATVGVVSAVADPTAWAYDNGRCSSEADVAPGDPETARRFTFSVILEDPGRRAAVVVVHVREYHTVGTSGGGDDLGGTEELPAAGSRRVFRFSYVLDTSTFEGGSGRLDWSADAFDASGTALAAQEGPPVSIYICAVPDSGVEPIVVDPTATTMPSATASPTATLAPTATRRPTAEPTSPPKPTTDPNDVDDDGDGQTENGGDCDDKNDKIYKGAPETPKDGVDSNCNGDDDS